MIKPVDEWDADPCECGHGKALHEEYDTTKLECIAYIVNGNRWCECLDYRKKEL